MARSKKETGTASADSARVEPAAAPEKHRKKTQQDGGRETFESIVVAFILAFLFRAFEAEAFVIPTGSMAPTLYGRHKDAQCEQCGFHWVFGASTELEKNSEVLVPSQRIEEALCPNCRYLNPVRNLPVYKGDRILVNKFPYEFSAPQRWDVPVFKYPEEPSTNYIKRLVGLPDETILIKRGDVYRIEEDRSRTILRKPPAKQKVIQIPVYDNNHPESALHARGWPRRWAPVERSDASSAEAGPGAVAGWGESSQGWQTSEDSRSFSLAADQAASARWLRYRHFVPRQEDWYEALEGDAAPNDPAYFSDAKSTAPSPQLITDFCGYNSYIPGNAGLSEDCYWVGDLTVSGRIDLKEISDGAALTLELNEGVRAYRVRIDLNTGKATLLSVLRFAGSENEDVLAESETRVSSSGDYDFRFANVDDRLCLWIDERLIDFGAAAEYAVDESLIPSPQDDDLTPVGIALANAAATVSDLLIERDIYYVASQADSYGSEGISAGGSEHPWPSDLRRELDDPAKWYEVYDARDREAVFELDSGEYLMLGDNSPQSSDSRLWPNTRGAKHRHAVPESALVGRAFYIYWPHGIPFMNDGLGYPSPLWGYHREPGDQNGTRKSDYQNMRIPFYPNFGRMRRIR